MCISGTWTTRSSDWDSRKQSAEVDLGDTFVGGCRFFVVLVVEGHCFSFEGLRCGWEPEAQQEKYRFVFCEFRDGSAFLF